MGIWKPSSSVSFARGSQPTTQSSPRPSNECSARVESDASPRHAARAEPAAVTRRASHLAAYMELIHVATLIHDDVVDNARRARRQRTAVDYGNRVSVFAGDYLFAWIFKNVTLNYPHPSQRALRNAGRNCDGEVLQLQAIGTSTFRSKRTSKSRAKKPPRFSRLRRQCGAIMGGGNAVDIEALREFGEAFRHRVPNERRLSRRDRRRTLARQACRNDLVERKTTIPLIGALASGNGHFRAEVRSFYEEGGNDAIPVGRVGIEREGGLRGDALADRSLCRARQAALEPIAPSPAKRELAQLTDALLYGVRKGSST